MSDFIRPKAVRETSGTVRRAGKSGRTAWIEPCDPMPEEKLPLKKRPLELDSKSAGRMCDECFLFTLEKQRKKRKKIGKEIRRKPNQAVFTSHSSVRICKTLEMVEPAGLEPATR